MAQPTVACLHPSRPAVAEPLRQFAESRMMAVETGGEDKPDLHRDPSPLWASRRKSEERVGPARNLKPEIYFYYSNDTISLYNRADPSGRAV